MAKFRHYFLIIMIPSDFLPAGQLCPPIHITSSRYVGVQFSSLPQWIEILFIRANFINIEKVFEIALKILGRL